MTVAKTFYLGVSKDHHRDDVYKLFTSLTPALQWASAEVNDMTRGKRSFEDVLNDRMRLEGWRFCVTVGQEGNSVQVQLVRLEQ